MLLKVKDNVDLKELKKRGFKKEKFLGYVLYGETKGNWQQILISVNENTRKIWVIENKEEVVLDLLGDLIEKVEDK